MRGGECEGERREGGGERYVLKHDERGGRREGGTHHLKRVFRVLIPDHEAKLARTTTPALDVSIAERAQNLTPLDGNKVEAVAVEHCNLVKGRGGVSTERGGQQRDCTHSAVAVHDCAAPPHFDTRTMLFGRSATLRSHSAFFTWKKHEPYSGFSFNVSTKTSCSSSSFPTLSAGLRSARIFIAHSITLF